MKRAREDDDYVDMPCVKKARDCDDFALDSALGIPDIVRTEIARHYIDVASRHAMALTCRTWYHMLIAAPPKTGTIVTLGQVLIHAILERYVSLFLEWTQPGAPVVLKDQDVMPILGCHKDWPFSLWEKDIEETGGSRIAAITSVIWSRFQPLSYKFAKCPLSTKQAIFRQLIPDALDAMRTACACLDYKDALSPRDLLFCYMHEQSTDFADWVPRRLVDDAGTLLLESTVATHPKVELGGIFGMGMYNQSKRIDVIHAIMEKLPSMTIPETSQKWLAEYVYIYYMRTKKDVGLRAISAKWILIHIGRQNLWEDPFLPHWLENVIWNLPLPDLRVCRGLVKLAQTNPHRWTQPIFRTRGAAFWLNVCLRMRNVKRATWMCLFDRWPRLMLCGPLRANCVYPLPLGDESLVNRERKTRRPVISTATLVPLLIAVPPNRIDPTFDIVDEYMIRGRSILPADLLKWAKTDKARLEGLYPTTLF